MTKLQRLLGKKDNEELAFKLMVSIRTIQRWKAGHCEPYHPTAKREVIRMLEGKK